MQTFWDTLPRPILGLSPMDGVTDQPFRFIQKKYGNPSLIYTEFTSAEGVCHGATRLLEDFMFDETQRPIIAQIYGTTPSFFRQTATILCELGFDGIDINMGCPAKNVRHSGAGAALIKSPELAVEIIRETKAGVADYANGKRAKDCPDIVPEISTEVAKRHLALPKEYQEIRDIPVSIKTRIGYSHKVTEWWIQTLLSEQPVAIAVHGRILTQHHAGPVDWDEIAKAAQLCKNAGVVCLGNGDVHSVAEAQQKVAEYGVDGVLIGRSSMGNPFVFAPDNGSTEVFDENTGQINKVALAKRFAIAVEHAQLFEDTYSHKEQYNFLPMRKHLGWYVTHIPQAAEIRQEMFKTNSAQEVKALFERYELL